MTREHEVMPSAQIDSIRNFLSLVSIGEYDPNDLPVNIRSWVIVSVGGDYSKAIAVNEKLGISIKCYSTDRYAELMYDNYSEIKFPQGQTPTEVLMPVGQIDNALVFPYIEGSLKDKPTTNDLLYFRALKEASGGDYTIGFPFAGTPGVLVSSSGKRYLTDLFDDNINTLREYSVSQSNSLRGGDI